MYQDSGNTLHGTPHNNPHNNPLSNPVHQLSGRLAAKEIPESLHSVISRRDTWLGYSDLASSPHIDNA
ncbi:MAG: hypothetical protein AB8B76_12935, partial [Congregibacter sp.]